MRSRSNLTVLNVAEKPSVAGALAGIYSRLHGSKDGGMMRQANHIFAHTNVQFPNDFSKGNGTLQTCRNGPNNEPPHKMITKSVRGHLTGLEFVQNYGWNQFALLQLFDAPIETIYRDDMVPLEQMICQQACQVDVVILSLKFDHEGRPSEMRLRLFI